MRHPRIRHTELSRAVKTLTSGTAATAAGGHCDRKIRAGCSPVIPNGQCRGSQLEPHHNVFVGVIADHEGIGAFGLEAIFLIETASAVIVGEDRQIQMVGALVAGSVDHPAH